MTATRTKSGDRRFANKRPPRQPSPPPPSPVLRRSAVRPRSATSSRPPHPAPGDRHRSRSYQWKRWCRHHRSRPQAPTRSTGSDLAKAITVTVTPAPRRLHDGRRRRPPRQSVARPRPPRSRRSAGPDRRDVYCRLGHAGSAPSTLKYQWYRSGVAYSRAPPQHLQAHELRQGQDDDASPHHRLQDGYIPFREDVGRHVDGPAGAHRPDPDDLGAPSRWATP